MKMLGKLDLCQRFLMEFLEKVLVILECITVGQVNLRYRVSQKKVPTFENS